VVVNGMAFSILLGKDWIGENVKYIDVQEHCLVLKDSSSIPMVQGDSTDKGQRSLAVRVMQSVQATTASGFTMQPGTQQHHLLGVLRDQMELEAPGMPSMIVVLPDHIQAMVSCEVSWSGWGELLLTTTNNSGTPWIVEPGTIVAVEEPSAVNQWNGFCFSLFASLKIPAGIGRGVTTQLRCSRAIHKSMPLNLQQVWTEGCEGTYQVFPIRALGKSVQEVTVINRTDRELEIPPGIPLMVHVDKWTEDKNQDGDKEDK
jgi:hypothetical protein